MFPVTFTVLDMQIQRDVMPLPFKPGDTEVDNSLSQRLISPNLDKILLLMTQYIFVRNELPSGN